MDFHVLEGYCQDFIGVCLHLETVGRYVEVDSVQNLSYVSFIEEHGCKDKTNCNWRVGGQSIHFIVVLLILLIDSCRDKQQSSDDHQISLQFGSTGSQFNQRRYPPKRYFFELFQFHGGQQFSDVSLVDLFLLEVIKQLIQWHQQYILSRFKQKNNPYSSIIIIIMGIIRLGQFLKKNFVNVLHKRSPSKYKDKVFAVDASSTIYSFLAKTISKLVMTYSNSRVNIPTDSSGNLTGHLIGLLYRVLLCKELGMETVWVFDGRPPRQKSDQLYRRRLLKQEAAEKVDIAKEQGDIQEAVKQSKRTIYITQTQRQDAKKLIRLMGLPVISAPSQAEAQCAWLAKNKLVEGVIGEDIDTIVFGAPQLIKNFKRDELSTEINLDDVLKALELDYSQFIDFCILCGCDYTSKIPMIGPVKALKFIKQHGNIQKAVDFILNDDKMRKKHPIPDDFNFLIARRLFYSPKITQTSLRDLRQDRIYQDELRNFLLQKQFNQKRIDNWIKKIKTFDSNGPIL